MDFLTIILSKGNRQKIHQAVAKETYQEVLNDLKHYARYVVVVGVSINLAETPWKSFLL